MGVPVSLHSGQLRVLSAFLIFPNLIGKRCYPTVLICISLITSRVEHFFICSLAIFIVSHLFMCFVCFPVGCLVFLVVIYNVLNKCRCCLLWYNHSKPGKTCMSCWGQFCWSRLLSSMFCSLVGCVWCVFLPVSYSVIAAYHEVMPHCPSSYQTPVCSWPVMSSWLKLVT